MKKLKDMKLNGTKLSDLRMQSGLTLESMAEEIEVDPSTISLWENGERQPGPQNLKRLADYFKVPMRSILLSLAILAVCQQAWAMDRGEMTGHMAPYWNSVVGAIYRAEGGPKARKPFGILSVPCAGYSECREVCYATVRNNYFRWIDAGRPGEYLEFLAKRYAPVGAENDPTGLNRNWLKNVRHFIEQD